MDEGHFKNSWPSAKLVYADSKENWTELKATLTSLWKDKDRSKLFKCKFSCKFERANWCEFVTKRAPSLHVVYRVIYLRNFHIWQMLQEKNSTENWTILKQLEVTFLSLTKLIKRTGSRIISGRNIILFEH